MTISEAIVSTTEIRVMEDTDNPNTSGYPTVKDYLTLESGDGFKFAHMDQTYLITQED